MHAYTRGRPLTRDPVVVAAVPQPVVTEVVHVWAKFGNFAILKLHASITPQGCPTYTSTTVPSTSLVVHPPQKSCHHHDDSSQHAVSVQLPR